MRSAGFDEATIIVYQTLLMADHMGAKQIEESTRLYADEVQRSLRRLLELNAVVVDAIRGRLVYYALDPELVWPAYTKRITWKFITSLIDTDIEDSIARLPKTHREVLEHFRATAHNIGQSAKEMYTSSLSIMAHQWRDAADNDQLSRLLAEAILHSRSTIRAVSKSPRLSRIDLIWQSIQSAMSRKVKYQRVADLTEIVEHGLLIVTRDINEHQIDLRVLDTGEVDQKFYVIDKSLLVVFHQLSHANRDGAIGRVTTHSAILDRYRKRFSKYYSNAVPGLLVVDMLRRSGERILERALQIGCNSYQIAWLAKVIDWGVFCIDPDPFSDTQNHEQHPAIEHGLLKKGTTGHLVPRYDISMQDIRRLTR